jgi:hypothetical protein
LRYHRKLAKLTVLTSHGGFGAANDFGDVRGAGDQRWVICLDRGEACPSIGYHIQGVEEAEGRAVTRFISEQRIVVGSEIRVARVEDKF